MTVYEIGVSDPQATERVRWTGQYVLATDENDALDKADEQGYYRNVRVRPRA